MRRLCRRSASCWLDPLLIGNLPNNQFVNLFQQPLQIVEVFFRQAAQQGGDGLDAARLVFLVSLGAGRGQGHVDLALVLRIDTTGDQRPFAVLQRADDAGHLGGQDAELPLYVADDQRLVLTQDRKRNELDLFEVADAGAGRAGPSGRAGRSFQ